MDVIVECTIKGKRMFELAHEHIHGRIPDGEKHSRHVRFSTRLHSTEIDFALIGIIQPVLLSYFLMLVQPGEAADSLSFRSRLTGNYSSLDQNTRWIAVKRNEEEKNEESQEEKKEDPAPAWRNWRRPSNQRRKSIFTQKQGYAQWRCNACNVNISGDENKEQHIKGRKHEKAKKRYVG